MTLPSTTQTAVDPGAGQQEPPFPTAPIEELLRLLVKASRAHQLYLPNNPVYKGAIEALRSAFAPIWQQTGEFALRFTETQIKWFGRAVLTETTKSADSLPWTIFKDGIREIQFSAGFEQAELVTFLEILQRVRKASPEEDDLLTMLWEADFTHLRYKYIDLSAEPVTPLGGEPPPTPPPADQVHAAVHEKPDESRPNVVDMQDFDATLYFLDEKELNYLRGEIEREYQSDLRRNVVSMLLDIYEAQANPAIRAEISDLIDNVLLMLLAAGQMHTVAYLLAETQVTAQRAPNITSAERDRIGQLSERLSMPEPLGQLLQTLDESADIPPQAQLSALFEQLRPTALATIFAWLPHLNNDRIRVLVEHSADRLAAAHTAELVKLVLSKDRAVSLEAVRRAGALKTPAAVVPMAKLLAGGADVSLRLATVHALTEIGSAGALQSLERSIEDPDRDVRVAAARALGAKAYRGVFSRIETAVKGKPIRAADLTEKMAFFEAYGAMCGDGGVAFLDGLLNGKTMFGKREDSELRACAAMALGRIGTPKAKESLQQASSEKDAVVRNAVNRATRTSVA